MDAARDNEINSKHNFQISRDVFFMLRQCPMWQVWTPLVSHMIKALARCLLYYVAKNVLTLKKQSLVIALAMRGFTKLGTSMLCVFQLYINTFFHSYIF